MRPRAACSTPRGGGSSPAGQRGASCQLVTYFFLRALAPACRSESGRFPGTMNNLAAGTGSASLGDYSDPGRRTRRQHQRCRASPMHAHMTNTLSTPHREPGGPLSAAGGALCGAPGLPGGRGRHAGGEAGVERSYRFLEPAEVTLLGERRKRGPWGLAGGGDGAPGADDLNGTPLPAKVRLQVGGGRRPDPARAGRRRLGLEVALFPDYVPALGDPAATAAAPIGRRTARSWAGGEPPGTRS
ncbi:MAG: hydantoinase B/oxoprolinase family protein [Gammaproteobacteria bacterium]|nr:hydantoinase B/oxoprolinase family protein [Gammaproteobacteria bacterium]